MSVYTDNGYRNRREYLDELASNSGVPRKAVYALAQMLGPTEDFDGLVNAIEDVEAEMERQARMPLLGGLSPYAEDY